MRCPRCKADKDRVVDSRTSADGSAIRRRRECLGCYLRYTTYERIENTPLRVVKKSGEHVRFDRERILAGMVRACEKLNVLTEELEEATTRIEVRCHEEFDREVPSAVVGDLVMEELKALNQVAYVRFASVYREFKDVTEFLDELKPILEERPAEASEEHGAG
ncbi:MAG TPA: transcriptional repressor NrdR [Planctomycetes bacterium]|nr:transcriptional repressor NrdR [Planctomycetota bacterium]